VRVGACARARSRPIFKVRKRCCGEFALSMRARHKVWHRKCALISPAPTPEVHVIVRTKTNLVRFSWRSITFYTLFTIIYVRYFLRKTLVNHVWLSRICVGACTSGAMYSYKYITFIIRIYTNHTWYAPYYLRLWFHCCVVYTATGVRLQVVVMRCVMCVVHLLLNVFYGRLASYACLEGTTRAGR